jgi:hypothetical protein
MKFKTIKTSVSFALTMVVLASSFAFGRVEDRTTEKTREAVENASPHDWYTLATSAEKCFKKKVNLKQASDWLDQSLAIAQTPFNLELKGDYFIDNKLPNRALDYYVRAMNAMKESDGKADITKLQKKISKIINIGG